jgi:GAF domain-containing protein
VHDRESWVTGTLVELADTLVSDFDLADLLATLVDRCVELLEAAEVGILLLDARDRLQVMASSSERMHAIELLELQNEEGPCFDSIREGASIGVTPLDAASLQRWPIFGVAAADAGYVQVLALPMRLRDEVIGAVNVFCDHEGQLPQADLLVAQALADAATIGILQSRALEYSDQLVAQLQGALNTRVVIEQAKGMLAESQAIPIEAAFERLRSYARSNNLRLSDVAQAVSRRELPPEAVGPARG